MGQVVIEYTVSTSATPAAVFTLLKDGSTWPEWSPLGSFELLERGDGEPEGLSAVRLFTTGRHKSVEKVVTITPDSEFSYVLLEGLPLRDYRAVISLVPRPGAEGTTITWRSTFHAKTPGTGWLYRLALGRFIGKTVRGLGEAAARLASDTQPGGPRDSAV
jgi:hypothetical protein